MENFMWSLKDRPASGFLCPAFFNKINFSTHKEDTLEELQVKEYPVKKQEPDILLTVTEATQDIEYFDGSNIDPLLFIEKCQEAYKKIHPSDIYGFTIIIRSKIFGIANDVLSHTPLNFDEILLDIRKIFVPIKDQNFFEIISDEGEQKIYENPITFWKRLWKTAEYYKNEIYKLSKSEDSVLEEIDRLEEMLISTYICGLKNTILKLEIKMRQPNSMIECFEITQKLWDCMNYSNDKNISNLVRINMKNCVFCEMRRYHYQDCPFKNDYSKMDDCVKGNTSSLNNTKKEFNNKESYRNNKTTAKNKITFFDSSDEKYCQTCKTPGHLTTNCKLHQSTKNAVAVIAKMWTTKLSTNVLSRPKLKLRVNHLNTKFCKTCKRRRNPTSGSCGMRFVSFCPDCIDHNRTHTKNSFQDYKHKLSIIKSKRLMHAGVDVTLHLGKLDLSKSTKKS